MYSDKKVKIIVIAPFWRKSDHVGVYRVERFVRRLVSVNYHVTIIWSGWEDNKIKKGKWDELEIRDPLRRFTRNINDPVNNRPKQGQYKSSFSFRKILQSIVFYFDRELVWSLLITRKALVKDACKHAEVVISSSPPESIHLASYILSKKFNLKLLVDMRDGWLDEPMRQYGRKRSIKRNIEKKWEYKILTKASRVIVTSKIWADMLKQRIPMTGNKITILTNAYPIDLNTPDYQPNSEKLSNILLLHAGRFSGTRDTNRMSILMKPLYEILKSRNDLAAEIILLGDLLNNDLEELKNWGQQFISTSSKIVTKNRMHRTEMFKELTYANGLLLLAATKAFFPSKTFEYIKAGKPILAVTVKDSSIWQVGQILPQMFLFDYTSQKPDYKAVEEFLNACQTGLYEYNIPKEYSEEYLSKIFLDTIKKV